VSMHHRIPHLDTGDKLTVAASENQDMTDHLN
jgi:hypothetical protein